VSNILIKLDEDLPHQMIAALEATGADVATVVGQKLGGTPDADLWPIVKAEGRMFFTADVKFADVRLHKPDTHPGVVLFRAQNESWQAYVELAAKLVREVADFAQLVGAITVVTAQAIRIRRGG
jgi:predicted nuclease of predicted toxin-antitoxin system